jgi:hypothetical protein
VRAAPVVQADPITTIGVVFEVGSFLVGTISLIDQLTDDQKGNAPQILSLDYTATKTLLSLTVTGSAFRGDLAKTFNGTAVAKTETSPTSVSVQDLWEFFLILGFDADANDQFSVNGWV